MDLPFVGFRVCFWGSQYFDFPAQNFFSGAFSFFNNIIVWKSWYASFLHLQVLGITQWVFTIILFFVTFCGDASQVFWAQPTQTFILVRTPAWRSVVCTLGDPKSSLWTPKTFHLDYTKFFLCFACEHQKIVHLAQPISQNAS